MKETKIEFPDSRALSLAKREAEEEVRGLPALRSKFAQLVVRTPEDYEMLMEGGRKVREIDRRVEDKQKSMTRLCDTLKKSIVDLFKPIRQQCSDVLLLVDEKREEYDELLGRERKEREEQARKAAERELKRLQKKAERLAAKAESRQEAKEILAEVPQVEDLIVPVAEVEAPKIDGVSVAKIWDFEITDPEEVPEWINVPEGERTVQYTLWERIYNRRALLDARERGVEVPGVRFFQKDSVRYERL